MIFTPLVNAEMNWDKNGMVTFKKFLFAFTQPKIRRSESIEPAPQEASSSSLLFRLGSSSSCSMCAELMVEITMFTWDAHHRIFLSIICDVFCQMSREMEVGQHALEVEAAEA
jgi:hypothetical protein